MAESSSQDMAEEELEQELDSVLSDQHGRQKRHKRFRSRFYRPFRRRSKVGAAPGQVSADTSAETTFIQRVIYNQETFIEEAEVDLATLGDLASIDADLDSLPVAASSDSPVVQWINVFGLADMTALKHLAEHFGLHPLTLEDIVQTHQRPKFEVTDGVLSVIMHRTDQKIPFHYEQVSFVISGNTLISFQEKAEDSFGAVSRRLKRGTGRIRESGVDYLLYCLVDTVIDGYFPLLEAYGRSLEQLEEDVSDDPSGQDQIRIRMFKRELAAIRKTSWSQRDLIQRLMVEKTPYITQETQVFLRDSHDHILHIVDVTESFREVVSDLRDLYFTKLSQRTNDIMQVLTIISTIFMPMSFIAGVYGMNFNTADSPYNMPETAWEFGYPFALALMGLSAVGMLLFFLRRGWLRR